MSGVKGAGRLVGTDVYTGLSVPSCGTPAPESVFRRTSPGVETEQVATLSL